ncbi:SMI1/KNR4 family protein [Siansivirga zeaxanthinifaciens]|uniref:Cell wall assembly protein Knr4 n=1 Tax=Siansivirga zeaxanthinifaciens CC-SAMT-1 TaxID=1454006 RepID=A0A0C5WDP5_9FLAO|nr:SMI1/KNR4 family protein [Siansivirga zeaxanthinifaciens]AJR03369.1 cell wall assembly protein Knr4 [Siansivirga zeaxanthinifaciens CC-SAMT-1]
MRIEIFTIIFIASLTVRFLHFQNKKKSDIIKKKMQERVEIAKRIKAINESSYNKLKISRLLITMLEEFQFHLDVQPTLTETELIEIEKQINLSLPLSYKLFLKYFGDGGTWIYANSIDSIRNRSWLSNYRKELDEKIELDNKKIKVDSLLCLMAEDSNGGAWCWLTTEDTKDGEWPLAYYSISDKKLHYKVQNFTEWIQILVNSKEEVIKELDLDYKLGLG